MFSMLLDFTNSLGPRLTTVAHSAVWCILFYPLIETQLRPPSGTAFHRVLCLYNPGKFLVDECIDPVLVSN